MENLSRNAENVQKAVREAVGAVPAGRSCRCGQALAHALVTDRARIPAATKKRLAAIVGKYLS
jgi:5'-methylthioadenosine phosphorylase